MPQDADQQRRADTNAALGLAFFLLSVYTVGRTLAFLHLKGRGNLIIKAFHYCIFVTASIRCLWCWTPKTPVQEPAAMMDSYLATATHSGDFLAASLHTLGTMSLFSTFLILCCYWSYMLEHVTLKISNIETTCFVPMHLLSDEVRQSFAPPRTITDKLLRTTVIEVYLLVMKALLLIAAVDLAGFLASVLTWRQFLCIKAVAEIIASVSCVLSLVIMSRRIQALLKTYGSQSQALISQHMDRVQMVTIGVSSFLLLRVVLEIMFLSCAASPSVSFGSTMLGERKHWESFTTTKHTSEAAVLLIELFVSRILTRRQAPEVPAFRISESESSQLDHLACAGSGDVEIARPFPDAYTSRTLIAKSSTNSGTSTNSGLVTDSSASLLRLSTSQSERAPLISSSLSKMAAYAAVGRFNRR